MSPASVARDQVRQAEHNAQADHDQQRHQALPTRTAQLTTCGQGLKALLKGCAAALVHLAGLCFFHSNGG